MPRPAFGLGYPRHHPVTVVLPIVVKGRYNRISFLPLQRVSMDKAPGLLIADQRVQRSRPVPRLRLLTELEPRHRVFFGNLADLLLSRRVPQVPITSRPARFWNDVFVPSGAPWSSFLESMLLHLLLIILFVWGQSRVWVSVKLFPQRDAFHRSITYYPPTPSFPAAGSRASSVRTHARVKHDVGPSTGPSSGDASEAGAKTEPGHTT